MRTMILRGDRDRTVRRGARLYVGILGETIEVHPLDVVELGRHGFELVDDVESPIIEDLGKPELLELAVAAGVEGAKSMTKADLLEALAATAPEE